MSATLRLASEAQIARLSAILVMSPTIWRFNETVLATDLANVGAATAEDVQLRFQWLDRAGQPFAPARNITLPAITPGQRIPYHPDTALREVDPALNNIDAEAAANLALCCEWSWTDGRRDWRLRPKRSARSLRVSLSAFRASVYGGPQILEHDEVDRLLQGARDMVGDLKTFERMRGEDSTISGVEGRHARGRGPRP